jgi:hypothetical protein
LSISRVWAAFNYASGDDNPDNGASGAFDPLFGSRAEFYGYSQLVRWSNIINPSVHVELVPFENAIVRLNYRVYWLDSAKGALSGTSFEDPEGSAGKFVGQEIEAKLIWSPLDWLTLEAAGAYLFSGEFVDDTLPDAPETAFFYVSGMVRF